MLTGFSLKFQSETTAASGEMIPICLHLYFQIHPVTLLKGTSNIHLLIFFVKSLLCQCSNVDTPSFLLLDAVQHRMQCLHIETLNVTRLKAL